MRRTKVDLVAVASRDQARADEYAQQWEIPRAFGSYDELLADPEIEAVYISLPNTMHCEWSIRALEAGKHVLCEKPLSRHPDEVSAAFDAADRTGLHLSEAFMYRHNPQTKRLKELVDERCDRRASPRPLRVQLLALRPRQHPAAHRRRGRRADGRRLLQRQRLAPARRRARARLRRGLVRAVGHRLGLRRDAALPGRRARELRLRHRPAGAATSSRRSAARARSSSTTRGTAGSR